MSEFNIEIDEDLEDIVPGFLENRKKDLIELQTFLKDKNLKEIEKIGHKVSGSSGGYGFHELGNIAKEMEKLAMEDQINGLESLISDFEKYITNVKVTYVNMD
jgi:HPt (histidine-containing phosphotransfer) domain-containing protein